MGYSDIHPLEPLEEIETKRKLGDFNKPNIFRFSRLATPSKEIYKKLDTFSIFWRQPPKFFFSGVGTSMNEVLVPWVSGPLLVQKGIVQEVSIISIHFQHNFQLAASLRSSNVAGWEFPEPSEVYSWKSHEMGDFPAAELMTRG